MFKLMSSLAMAGAILFLTCAAPAKATSIATFVSAKGTDSGTCALPATPCRGFQFAINQTSAFGAVKVLTAIMQPNDICAARHAAVA